MIFCELSCHIHTMPPLPLTGDGDKAFNILHHMICFPIQTWMEPTNWVLYSEK